MRICKAALVAFFRHPLYLVIYVVALSCVCLLMGTSTTESTDSYVERPTIAIIDRDGGELAQGLADFARAHADVVEVEDSERALQDAVMQERAQYIMIIPAGFSAQFARAAEQYAEAPQVQTVASTQAFATTMMDNLVDEYLNVARMYTLALPDASQVSIVERTNAAMEKAADVSVAQTADAPSQTGGLLLYLQFASYTILLSISICSAVVMARFNRAPIRQRMGAAPVGVAAANLQLAAACFIIMLICWAFVCVLGLAAYGGEVQNASPGSVAGACATLLCYALFALALGFLMGQLTSSETAMNAIANSAGLVFSFLGGIWVPLAFVGEPIATIARFLPTFYYNEALQGFIGAAAGANAAGSAGAGGAAASSAASAGAPNVPADLAVICLFALAVFAIGLACSRAKQKKEV